MFRLTRYQIKPRCQYLAYLDLLWARFPSTGHLGFHTQNRIDFLLVAMLLGTDFWRAFGPWVV